jgi:hypothetical protein
MLDTPEVARFSLRRQMKKLQDSADKCKVEAEHIETKFDEWLQFTFDLQEAAIDREGK